jgi:GNAT superfamily N-acetyltransferase
VEIVAEWLVSEWSHLYPDWDHRSAVTELLSQGEHSQPPCTWLLFDSEDLTDTGVLGSVGLSLGGELEDAAISPPSGVWVVNLFVLPSARGRGHGTALLEHAVDHAGALGLSELLLTTEHSEMHYGSQGWRTIGPTTLNGHHSVIMTRSLLDRPAVAP